MIGIRRIEQMIQILIRKLRSRAEQMICYAFGFKINNNDLSQ